MPIPLYAPVERNLRAAMASYGQAGAGGGTRVVAQVALTSSGLQYPVFNSAMLTAPVATENELRKLIAIPQVHFRARDLGWSYWVCEDLIEQPLRNAAGSIFGECGMKPVAYPYGMHAKSIRPGPTRETGLTCVYVNDDPARAAFARIASVVFSLPLDIAEAIYASTLFWSSPVYGYLGYVNQGDIKQSDANQEAISIVSTVVAGGVAGVYSLGTLPAHRGRGYARALLRHALADTRRRNPFEGIVLQTNDQRMTLYRKLGFQTVTQFTIYLPQSSGTRG